MNLLDLPFKTLPQLLQYFNTEDKARDFLEKMRWPDGRIICPICGVLGSYRNSDMKTFTCRDIDCKSRFSVTVGTMMENTKLPLAKWFAAIWLITAHKKGISSCQLARDLGIGQKAAWFLNHRIRAMVIEKAPELLEDVVMVDEAHVGGKWANMNKTKRKALQEAGKDNKTAVVGMVSKSGKGILKVIGTSSSRELMKKHISKEAIVVTDEHGMFKTVANDFKAHYSVNHSQLEFKKDGYSTNAVEGVFSMLKRAIIGIYHQVSPYHLEKYCTETMYRFNTRKIKDVERFIDAMKKTQGRLKYKDLIKPKNEDSWKELIYT